MTVELNLSDEPELSPSCVGRRWFLRRRPGPSRSNVRVARTLALSPLLFAPLPLHESALLLLTDVEMAAPAPHVPAPLTGKQRHLIFLVDSVFKAVEASLGSVDDAALDTSDAIEFLRRFRLPRGVDVTLDSIDAVLDETLLSRILRDKFRSETHDLLERWDVSATDVDIVVYHALSTLAETCLNPAATRLFVDDAAAPFAVAARQLRDAGNRALLGCEEDNDDDNARRPSWSLDDDHEDDPSLSSPSSSSRVDRAVALYTAGVVSSPFDPRLYRNRAQCFFDSARYDLALPDALRSHALLPEFKSAGYLLGETLYRLGEVDAAKTVNRRAARPSHRLVDDEVNGIEDLESQFDRWIESERRAKDSLESHLEAATLALISRRDPLAAVNAFARADDVVDEAGCAALGVLAIDWAVIAYCRCLAYVESAIPYYIECAVETMKETLDDPSIKFPLGFLALAKAHRKAGRFREAAESAGRGADMLSRGVRMTGGCHYWPGSQILIEESRPDTLTRELRAMKAECERLADWRDFSR